MIICTEQVACPGVRSWGSHSECTSLPRFACGCLAHPRAIAEHSRTIHAYQCDTRTDSPPEFVGSCKRGPERAQGAAKSSVKRSVSTNRQCIELRGTVASRRRQRHSEGHSRLGRQHPSPLAAT